MRLEKAFFRRPACEVGRELIGTTLLVDGVGGMIVETEVYDRKDPASHSFGGQTVRNASMFGPVGCAYVYRSYGIHWCLNVVCGIEPGSAVLLRAIEPMVGLGVMRTRRGLSDVRSLCSGPGRLCQALGVIGDLDGAPLDQAPFAVAARSREVTVVAGGRVGISKGMDTPWRFGLAGSAFVSRVFPA